MMSRKLKGCLFAIISLFFVSMQPIIANSRPEVLDAFIFAGMTALFQALLFFPLLLMEQKSISKKNKTIEKPFETGLSYVQRVIKHKYLFIYIGINFSFAQIFFFIAYELAGALNGALAQQTSIVFGLIFGVLINNDKINKIQVLFAGILFFGLILAITQGSFNLVEINLGVCFMLACAALWMLAHAIVHPILEKNQISPIQLVFTRNILSGIFLVFTYFIIFPSLDINLLFTPLNMFFFFLMAFFYSVDLYFWYTSISYIEISKASVLVSPMPIVTAFFAFFLLSEIFTIFHLIGAVIVILCIIVIVQSKEKNLIVKKR